VLPLQAATSRLRAAMPMKPPSTHTPDPAAGISGSVRRFPAVVLHSDGSQAPHSHAVPVEAPLAIEVNGATAAHVMRTTGNDIELALGFCYTDGLIAGIDDVVSIRLCPDSAGVVRVVTRSGDRPKEAALLTSACAGGRMPGDADLPAAMPVEGAIIEVDALLTVGAAVRQSQPIRREAGAVHAAAVADLDGHLLAVREDVGRHNAIDKAIGACVYAGHSPGASVLVSTGRASSEMVLKATRAGIPVAASLSGSTSLGAELAHTLGLTLICYLRSGRMTVLARPERIVGAIPTPA